MEEHFLVFDFIDVVSIDFDKEDQDFESDVMENYTSYIYPNFLSKIPVQVIKKTVFEIDDISNNLRVIVKSDISAESITNKYIELICKFFNEPDEYKLGQQDFQFAEIKPGINPNYILSNSLRIENMQTNFLTIYNAYEF